MPTPAPLTPERPPRYSPRELDALKPRATQYDVFEGVVPGLALRVGTSGAKSWVLYYRRLGKLRRITIGHYATLGLAKARRTAELERGKIFNGGDPVADRQADRATWGDTVGALIDRYADSPARTQRQFAEKLRVLNRDVREVWGDRRVQDLTRRDVRTLIEAKARTAPVMGNRLLAHLCTLFNYALDQEWIEANPAARLQKPGEEARRDRVLTREEVRALWQTLTTPDPAQYIAVKKTVPHAVEREAFLALVLLGQRLTETCAMRWADLDLEAGWWTIPAAATKNKQPHHVPLSPPVLKFLTHRAKARARDPLYVFSRTPGTSIAARAKKTAATISKALGFSFRAHDLRRTVASGMAAAGVPRFDIACVLNHRSVTQHGITAAYDLYAYDREKQIALETWARVLEAIVAGRSVEKVVSIRHGR